MALTLRFLASGESLWSLALQFRCGTSTACTIVKDTSDAFYEVLAAEFLNTPQSASDWEKIATDYYDKWNFPLCLGALVENMCELPVRPRLAHSFTIINNFIASCCWLQWMLITSL